VPLLEKQMRNSRTLKKDKEGKIVKDLWERKGRAS
jgi:hypothetical protein